MDDSDSELTREEAIGEMERLAGELYRAEDRVAFVREKLHGRTEPVDVTTVLGWLNHQHCPRVESEQQQIARLTTQLDLATEFRIPCPEPADPGRPDGAPVMRPEPLIVRKCTTNWADRYPDGWLILNPNLQPGDQIWTGEAWEYRGQVYAGVIYQWTRDQAVTEAQRLAVEETARYEKWLAEQRAGRKDS